MKITQLKNGNYTCTIYLGSEGGKSITRRVTAPSRSDLKKEIHRIKAGNVKKQTVSDITLGEAMREYIDSHSNVFSPSTIKGFETIVRCSFLDLQKLPISAITQEALQTEINSMASKLSFKTLSNRTSLFIQSVQKYLPDAKNWDIKLPPKKRPELYIPTKEDIKTIIAYAHDYYPEFELPIMFGAYCGLRRGEICALTYEDINADSVTISKSVVMDAYGQYITKTPKTHSGFRSVPLSPSTLALIRERQERGLKLITVMPEQITDRFPFIVSGSGVHHMRFHDLRHYFASTLVILGIPDIYAIRLTGHSTTAMIQRVYQHTFNDAEEMYRKRLKGLL